MVSRKALHLIGCTVVCVVSWVSCDRNNPLYQIGMEETVEMTMTDFMVFGVYNTHEDSLITDSINGTPDYLPSENIPSADSIHRHQGIYHPLYNQLDLREVYGLEADDTTQVLAGVSTFLFCDIEAEKDRKLYLKVECEMPMRIWLNGDSLTRRDIIAPNFYPVALQKGRNRLAVRLVSDGNDLSFKASLCDSLTVAEIYTAWQSNNIVYALVDSVTKQLWLTNAHQNVLDAPVTLQIHDVMGQKVKEWQLMKDSSTYHVPELRHDQSYMLSMTMAGYTTRQPILCGKDDDALVKFRHLRASLSYDDPRADGIDQLLYRLEFLLNHPTRYEGDWWWQFKIPPVTYQLEHAFAHQMRTYGETDTEANILFVTYRSEQDDSLQRYVLARPNHIARNQPLPLVVVVRPFIENKHHFFSCPQIARQWAVNQMQAMAERYKMLIMMPEMRTYLNEDLTPEAEEEMKLAIEDVCKHYPVDRKRMFLHANCSGGYRALKMATDNTGMFAAIALYAPTYRMHYELPENEDTTSLANKIKTLRDTPLFIHYDPVDRHSPYSLFEALVRRCQKEGVPLTISVKRNSGRFFNVTLVGKEAMDFLERESGKRK